MGMMRRIGAGVLFSAMLAAAPLLAGTDHDEKVKKDLLTVITLQSQPCGAVLSFQRQGEHDYLVSCQSGDRYRVRLADPGRVVVEKQ
ncbi:MAG TPA: hypothetical protein VNP04_20300 [Alphaproteobacteria bacterium]|nr:hypothetical protein [Alphaproteobacteria bacterium]